MSFGPLLLRVMLILTFVLNGTTSAMATAQMSLGSMPRHETMQHATAAAQHHDMSGCHHESVHGHDATAAAHGPVPHSVPSKHHGHSSDCCGSGGSCQCVCAHGMHVTVPAPVLALHAYGREDESDEPSTGHDSPALQHLIRPPIG